MISVPYEVKKALRDGMLRKDYRFIVLNDDGTTDFTIDNDTLVSESVSIDERMCSGDTLKFGLCEGSSLEFQYFDHPNIYGRRLQAFVDVEYAPGENFYPIPMGFFDVKKCSRQASTGIMKVTAYNKLMSEYLDAKANELISEDIEDEDFTGSMSLYSLLTKLLGGYTIDLRVPQQMAINTMTTSYTFSTCHNIMLFAGDLRWQDVIGYDLYLHVPYKNFYTHLWGSDAHYVSTTLSDALAEKTSNLLYAFLDRQTDPYYNYYNVSYVNIGGYAQTTRALLKNVIRTTDYDDLSQVISPSSRFARISEIKGGMYWAKNNTYQPANYSEAILGIMDYNIGKFSLPFHYDEYEYITVEVPLAMWVDTQPTASSTAIHDAGLAWANDYIDNYGGIISYDFKKDLTPMEEYRVTENDFAANVTLRELQSAVFESACQFGQLDRVTDLFSGVELNHGGLYPAEDLYPANDLYPSGASMSASKAMYSQLWGDEGNVRKWRYLIITYKALDGEGNEVDRTLQRTINADGTDNYNMSDNWLFRNLVWTAEQVGEYADAMVATMQDITWFPFEMWCAGLPYLETGDEIEIPLNGESYTSYVLQRQLKGIQNLQDTYINGTLDIF